MLPRTFRQILGRTVYALLSILLLATTSGCMSLEHVLDPDARLAMYGGTESSLDYQAEGSSFFGKLFRMIDLPATLAMDTVLLPISMPVQLSRD